MPAEEPRTTPTPEEVAEFRRTRRDEGLKIDPATAEVTWWYRCDFDEYDLGLELPEELQIVSRNHFARSPGSDIWVSFADLPEATQRTLWQRMECGNFVDPLVEERVERLTRVYSEDRDGRAPSDLLRRWWAEPFIRVSMEAQP